MPEDTWIPPPSPALQGVLDWLAAAPAPDAIADLPALRLHLAASAEVAANPAQRAWLLAAFEARAARVRAAIRPLLLEATLPLARHLRGLAKSLLDVEWELAEAFLEAARGADRNTAARDRCSRCCASALDHLSRQLEIALLTAAPAPAGLWNGAQCAFHLARSFQPVDAAPSEDILAAEKSLKAMLALAATQPEAYTPHQIDYLIRFLDRHAASVELSLLPPDEPGGWYWTEESRDLPPVALNRRRPPQEGNCLFFSCLELARIGSDTIARLAAESATAEGETQTDTVNLLRQAQMYWATPPKRLLNRRRNNYRVQVCADLDRLWQLLHGDIDAEAPDIGYATTDWMVINESPGGYAVMHVSGDIAGIQAGNAIGLRPGPEQPWSVCLVRWARSDNPEHLELGLELITPAAEAVHIIPYRAGQVPQRALLLPALPRLERGESLLCLRGCYDVHGFVMIHETGGHIRISHGTPHGLWSQTSNIEIYEFERDPLPL